jgi:Tol biopolymer transport system component
VSGLAIVDSAGRRHIPGSEGVVDFSWNRDGSGFFVTRDGVLGSLPLEGGAVAEIYSDWVQARFPALSPDGRTLAVSVNLTDDAATGWEIWLLDVGGENPRHVAEGYDASWSPDGTKLYFERFYEAEPPVRLAVLDVATGETTPFLRESGRDFSVEVSPQRTYAAFSRGNARKLMLYTFADSALVALTRGGHGDRRLYDRFVSFSPDEDYIVFFRQVESSTHSTFQILGCDLTTGQTRIIEEGDVLRALFAPSRLRG